MSKEEIELRNRQEEDRLAKKLRYTERKSIDSYIGSILSLELFCMNFNSCLETVPDLFLCGHSEYKRIWEKLYLYETFNLILSPKRNNFEDKAAGDFINSAKKQRELKWSAYL